MAPMQDIDNGVCVHHERMAKQIDEIHSHLIGTLDSRGMITEHREMYDNYMEKKSESKETRRFIWQHIVGYLLTGLIPAGVVIILSRV